MAILINLLFLIAAFVCMEGVAWFTHKYIMHGWLWVLHADHHKKGEGQFFERNDTFFLIFATPSIALIYEGTVSGFQTPWFWIGLGITLYGFAYFFIHDIFIHQRFKWLRNADSLYFRAIRRAHKIHHKNITKEDGSCFGMLWVPFTYYTKSDKQIAE